MRSIALTALLLLASCGDEHKQDSTELAMQSGEQTAEIQQLEDRLDKLEQNQQADHAQIETTEAVSADAASGLDSLRNTVNGNVKIDNDRHNVLVEHVTNLEQRVYHGQ